MNIVPNNWNYVSYKWQKLWSNATKRHTCTTSFYDYFGIRCVSRFYVRCLCTGDISDTQVKHALMQSLLHDCTAFDLCMINIDCVKQWYNNPTEKSNTIFFSSEARYKVVSDRNDLFTRKQVNESQVHIKNVLLPDELLSHYSAHSSLNAAKFLERLNLP